MKDEVLGKAASQSLELQCRKWPAINDVTEQQQDLACWDPLPLDTEILYCSV